MDKVDTQKLFETGVSAMLKSLDPYTEFEGRQEAVEMQESVSGKYGGVGLVISGRDRKVLDPSKAGVDRLASDDVDAGTGATSDESSISMNTDSDSASPSPSEAKEEQSPGLQLQQKKDSTALEIAKKEEDGNDGIRVVSAFEGYAFDAGMRVGDKIVAVDDYKIGPETTVEAVRNHLRGDPGTFVAVSFLRDGVDGVQTVDVPRQIVKIHDVKAVTLLGNANEGVGYIQLSGFSQDAGREMRAAITALQRKAEIASNSDSSLKVNFALPSFYYKALFTHALTTLCFNFH